MKTKPTVIDCFSGAGGLSLGFQKAGFDIKFAFDNDRASITTYRENIGSHAFIVDIHKIRKKTIEDLLGARLPMIDVLIGGPPCQGFSVQRRGLDVDVRNDLVIEYLRVVFEFMPKFFLMENVGGLLSTRGRSVMDRLKSDCAGNGYSLHIRKLDASLYGIAQVRKRVFIVGERLVSDSPRFSFPEPSTVNGNASTVRQEIEDLMASTNYDVPNHKADKLSAINLERIRAIKEGEGRDSLPEHLQLECHRNNSSHRHLDVYGRMFWDQPAPTITARFDSFSRGRFGHPVLDRTITLREGARLQSFGDDFVFSGTKVEIARQVGNAVPPRLAQILAERLKACL